VLVVGIGSIGGTVAGGLLGHDDSIVSEVVGLTTNGSIIDAVSAHGYRMRSAFGETHRRGRLTSTLSPQEAAFDFIILATQPPQVEQVARNTLPWLADDGRMVVLQNGLCEYRIADIVGSDRVLGSVVGWGASSPEPGVFEQTSEGGFTIGRMDGYIDDSLRRLALLLEIIGPVSVSDNLAGARWSKLAINCAISTLGTIGGDTLGRLMPYLVVRRLALQIMTETVLVARAMNIQLERLNGTLDLEWLTMPDTEQQALLGSPSLVAKHALLLAVGMRYRRLRSSMLSAIERGRPPAVDFLNGEVVQRGAAHGIPTPVNATAQRTVHQIASGERESGLRTLRQLATEVGLQVGRFTGGSLAV